MNELTRLRAIEKAANEFLDAREMAPLDGPDDESDAAYDAWEKGYDAAELALNKALGRTEQESNADERIEP